MICPRCGAASRVMETRDAADGTQRRRRECDNFHRFSTWEVYEQTLKAAGKEDVAATWRRAQENARRWWRDRRVILDPRPAVAVAPEVGLTDTRVRQIRASHRTTHPGLVSEDNSPGGTSVEKPRKEH
jgi:hypothetical protein